MARALITTFSHLTHHVRKLFLFAVIMDDVKRIPNKASHKFHSRRNYLPTLITHWNGCVCAIIKFCKVAISKSSQSILQSEQLRGPDESVCAFFALIIHGTIYATSSVDSASLQR
jgi:hypothetical protein